VQYRRRAWYHHALRYHSHERCAGFHDGGAGIGFYAHDESQRNPADPRLSFALALAVQLTHQKVDCAASRQMFKQHVTTTHNLWRRLSS
jgi:hypothetical protein